MLRIELENARAIMSITRLKLAQYLAVLRQNIPGNTVDAIHQSMDGIEELCSLLKVKPSSSHTTTLPVECAFEVNEPASESASSEPSRFIRSSLPNPSLTFSPAPVIPPATTNRIYRRSEGDDARRSFVQQVQRADNNEFEISVSPTGVLDPLAYDEILYTSPAVDAAQMDGNESSSSSSGARYEIPDDGQLMSRKATKILGDRKEVEMHEFNSKMAREANRLRSGGEPMVDPPCDRHSPDE